MLPDTGITTVELLRRPALDKNTTVDTINVPMVTSSTEPLKDPDLDLQLNSS
jgi:hypothetical protein